MCCSRPSVENQRTSLYDLDFIIVDCKVCPSTHTVLPTILSAPTWKQIWNYPNLIIIFPVRIQIMAINIFSHFVSKLITGHIRTWWPVLCVHIMEFNNYFCQIHQGGFERGLYALLFGPEAMLSSANHSSWVYGLLFVVQLSLKYTIWLYRLSTFPKFVSERGSFLKFNYDE
jgi:hypothetical protein